MTSQRFSSKNRYTSRIRWRTEKVSLIVIYRAERISSCWRNHGIIIGCIRVRVMCVSCGLTGVDIVLIIGTRRAKGGTRSCSKVSLMALNHCGRARATSSRAISVDTLRLWLIIHYHCRLSSEVSRIKFIITIPSATALQLKPDYKECLCQR